MIKIEVVELNDSLLEEVDSLFKEHWEEIANYKEKIKLNVDTTWYKDVYQSGLYLAICAREDEKLIGYAGFIIAVHPHYKDNIFCNMDVAFLSKEYRKGFTGIRMFKFAEQELKKLDIDVITLRSKVHYNLGPIFEHLGYMQTEIAYSKYIGE